MTDYDVDVAVVGAGPAGSVVALELARRNVRVLVLEKRQEIGAPKRCAEGISAPSLQQLGLELDSRWVAQKIVATRLYSPKMREVTIAPKGLLGYILERKIFEKYLAAEAIKHGAKYLVKTTVTDVIKEDGRVAGVKAQSWGEEITVRAKIVIAADGVDSMTAKRAGIDTVNKLGDYHSGFQYEMAGVNADIDKLHIFIGSTIAPKGYVWIFPKGNTMANVGIGILGDKSADGARAKDLLDRFIEGNPRFFAGASPIEANGGGIPVNISVKTFVADGFMIIGDAAQQVNPIHGGGIALAMSAARMAAKVAAEALTAGDYSRERLLAYENEWKKTDGAEIQRILKLRHFVEKLDDNDLDSLVDVLSGDDVLRLMDGDNKFLLKVLLTKAPKLLSLARKFLQ